MRYDLHPSIAKAKDFLAYYDRYVDHVRKSASELNQDILAEAWDWARHGLIMQLGRAHVVRRLTGTCNRCPKASTIDRAVLH